MLGRVTCKQSVKSRWTPRINTFMVSPPGTSKWAARSTFGERRGGRLPRLPGGQEAGPGTAADVLPGSGLLSRMGERIKVLLVEDDGDSRELLAELLEMDFDVITASDGLSGLRAFEKDHPDVVVTDESLPGMWHQARPGSEDTASPRRGSSSCPATPTWTPATATWCCASPLMSSGCRPPWGAWEKQPGTEAGRANFVPGCQGCSWREAR